jgi:hypothetical protein
MVSPVNNNMIVRTLMGSALLSLALGAAGETVVTLERDGAAVGGGEVCRFAARDRENPIRRWLAFQDVTCVAAGSAMAFPRGLWNVFGKVEGKAVSDPIVIDGSKAPSSLSLSLTAGAALTPRLPEGSTAVFYAPRRGSAFPFNATMQHVTVPASEELWAIVLEKTQPVGIVKIPASEAESERAVDGLGSAGSPFVLGWIQVPEADRIAMTKAQSLNAPGVHFTSRGSSRDSEPLPAMAMLHGSFFLVRGAPAGEGELDIGGRGWIPYRTRLKIDTRVVTVANGPLMARLSGSIFVNWSANGGVTELDRSLGSCGGEDRSAQFVVSVSACASADAESCRVVRQETFPPQLPFGSFTVDDLPPGDYRAELHFGKLPNVVENVRLSALQQQRVRIQAGYEEIYGSLTHGGQPLGEDAALTFPGQGIGFASRETGEYHAVLLHQFETDARIEVASCRGGFRGFVLADHDSRPHTRFDIDIPDNVLTINVVDTFTRAPLDDATVHYSIMSRSAPLRPVVTGELRTRAEDGASGRLITKSLPERELRIFVTHTGYQKRIINPLTMLKSDKKTIDVELLPLNGQTGRFLSPLPFDRGSISWFNAGGSLTEATELDPDGNFIYSGQHGPDETMAVVSASHPLWVVRAPAMPRHEVFTVPFPAMSRREFDITIPGTNPDVSTYVGLVVGGVRVPYPALRAHQTLRNLPSLVPGSGPLHIRDLGETGSIDVILGPPKDEALSRMSNIDVFALAQFVDAPRKRLLPGVGVIALER